MKKNFKVNCAGLLLLLIFAVFVSFYYNNVMDNFEMMKGPEYKGPDYNSPYVSCSSYNATNCPVKNCTVLTDTTRCSGGAAPSNLSPGDKNYNVPDSSYANDSNSASCGSAGYLKTCATKSLQ